MTVHIYLVIVPLIAVIAIAGISFFYLQKYKKDLDAGDINNIDSDYKAFLVLISILAAVLFSLMVLTVWGGVSIPKLINPEKDLEVHNAYAMKSYVGDMQVPQSAPIYHSEDYQYPEEDWLESYYYPN